MTTVPSFTSVVVSWKQSSTRTGYRISLTRVTGAGNVHCTEFTDDRPMVMTSGLSYTYINLEEFSIYRVTVMSLGITPARADIRSATFTTLGAGNNS